MLALSSRGEKGFEGCDDLGFHVRCSGFRLQGLGFRVYGSLGFWACRFWHLRLDASPKLPGDGTRVEPSQPSEIRSSKTLTT